MKQLGPRVRVTRVEPLDGYKVRVLFDNDEVRDIDFELYLAGPIFEPLRINRELYKRMKIEGGTIAWENGADIDPDVLYYGLTPSWMEDEESLKTP